MKEFQEQILQVLQQTMEAVGYVAADDEVLGQPCLHIRHGGVGKNPREKLMSVYFLPQLPNADEQTMDCMIQVLMAEDIPDATFPTVKTGISLLNYALTRGSFVTSPDCTKLNYRHTVTFRKEGDLEQTARELYYHVNACAATAALFDEPLGKTVSGSMTLEGFAEAIMAIGRE